MGESNSGITSGNYNILKTDPEALRQLVNKYVKVQLIRDTEFLGFVYSIDPVHHSIILILPEKDSYKVNVIPGHAILDVVETHCISDYKVPEFQRPSETSDDIERRKHKLISWFKKNLLPITESGQKILFGNVSILPPYGVSNICTGNPVVATQLRKLINDMPDDFEADK